MKLLNSTKCICGIDQSKIKFDKYYPFRGESSFYGGRVDMLGDRVCECGRELKGYFHWNIDGKLELIDLEIIKDTTEEEKTENTPTWRVENGNDLQIIEVTVPYSPKSYEEMDFKELQTICKEKGINTFHKKREDLIKLLASIDA